MTSDSHHAIVVGAGIAGITAAAHLARDGNRVTVFEKLDQPGGRCSPVELNGYRFTSGPSLLVMRELYERAFDALGEELEDHLDLRRIDPTYYIYFGDGSQLELTSDLQAMRSQLEAMEPGSFDAYLKYLAEGARHYRLALPKVVFRNFRNLGEFANPAHLPLVFQLNLFRNHYQSVSGHFEDPRLKAAFTFQDMYMGLSPTVASAMWSMLQYSELVDGVWFPIGGMHEIVRALVRVAEGHGAKFIYRSPVGRVDVSGQRAIGITLDSGKHIGADIIVANADLPYVYRNLLPKSRFADRLERKKYGFSAIVFYWGLDRKLPELEAHNLFLTPSYPECLDSIFIDHGLPDDPPLYVHVPSRIDPQLAPDDCDAVMVAAPVGNINHDSNQDWEEIRAEARHHALRKLAAIGAIDIESHLQLELSHGPTDWLQQINLTNGSTHGLSHTLRQLAYMRPHNRHPKFRNLYFAGASTHPGTGIPSVLVSGRLVAERIRQEAPELKKAPSPVPVSSV